MEKIESVIKKASEINQETRDIVEEYFAKKEAGEDPDGRDVLDAVREEVFLHEEEERVTARLKFGEKVNDTDFIWEQLERAEKLELAQKYSLLYDLYLVSRPRNISIAAYNQIIIRLSNVVSGLSEIAYKKGEKEVGNVLRAKGIVLSQSILLG